MTSVSYPGRIGLTQIHGGVGFGIRVGQLLNGSGFEDFEHAFMDLGDGTLIEAEPGGARIRSLSEYDPADVHWCDHIYGQLTPIQRERIAAIARTFEGVPYSVADYFALTGHRLHLDVDALRRYISDDSHMICSQLVDRAYRLGGYEIFRDGRWDGFVTPGDLYLIDMRISLWEAMPDQLWE